jgi:hypothetical protein
VEEEEETTVGTEEHEEGATVHERAVPGQHTSPYPHDPWCVGVVSDRNVAVNAAPETYISPMSLPLLAPLAMYRRLLVANVMAAAYLAGMVMGIEFHANPPSRLTHKSW